MNVTTELLAALKVLANHAPRIEDVERHIEKIEERMEAGAKEVRTHAWGIVIVLLTALLSLGITLFAK